MIRIFFAACALLWAGLLCGCKGDAEGKQVDGYAKEFVCIAYAWEADGPLPPADMVTAVNYLAGYPNASLDGVRINNEARLRRIVDLKKENPGLKVLLSMGGSCQDGWSSLAASETLRARFADDCLRVVEEYGLDGMDFDWEFPGGEGGTKDDEANYTLLLRDVRKALGNGKLVTVAMGNTARAAELPKILDYVDYINVMTYDMGWQAPYHHTALRRSPLAGVNTVEEAMEAFKARGVPMDRMVLGLAFYGRGDGVNFKDWTDYRDIAPREGMEERWDDVACVPYIVDGNGQLIVGYDNAKSLKIKCDYIKELGLKGGMYWRTELDTDDRELTRTVAHELLGR